MSLDKKQKIQDSEYIFPYHYIPKYKNGFSQSYDWVWGIDYVSTIEFILEKIKESNADVIADIGTGDGRLVREIAMRYPDKEVVGIDYSQKAIALAKALNPNLDFFNINILKSEINSKYDLITLIEVFEHIPLELVNDFVLTLKGLLKKDGILLLTVPHKNKSLQKKHFQHFSPLSLKKYFEPYFNFEEEVFFEKKGLLIRIIHKLLSNQYFILNHQKLRNWLYWLYKKKCFFAEEENCGRIYLKLRKK